MLFKGISNIIDYIILIGPKNLKNFDFSSIETFKSLCKYVDYINNIELPNPED